MRRLAFIAFTAFAAFAIACSRTSLQPPDIAIDPCGGCVSACIAQRCVAVTQVAAAGRHACARLETGEVMCWGANDAAILGTGKPDDLSHPTPVVVPVGNVLDLAVSQTHACVVLADGAVSCWGMNDQGELGHRGPQRAPMRVPEVNLAAHVAVGPGYSCASSTAGTVWCWGNDAAGQLGDQGLFGSSPDARPVGIPASVTQLALGVRHACAVTSSGEMWCWGSNDRGQLGAGFSGGTMAPRKVSPLAWVTGAAAGRDQTCATRQGGVLSCWGGTDSASFPSDTRNAVEVLGVALGGAGACVERTAGAVQCGLLQFDKLGGLTFTGSDRMKEGATAITLGDTHGCAVLDDGAAACWGDNSLGQLGDGTTESRAEAGNVHF